MKKPLCAHRAPEQRSAARRPHPVPTVLLVTPPTQATTRLSTALTRVRVAVVWDAPRQVRAVPRLNLTQQACSLHRLDVELLQQPALLQSSSKAALSRLAVYRYRVLGF
jgi:hypothetical protein